MKRKNTVMLALTLVSALGGMSQAIASSENAQAASQSSNIVCDLFPSVCTVTADTGGNGGGKEPPTIG